MVCLTLLLSVPIWHDCPKSSWNNISGTCFQGPPHIKSTFRSVWCFFNIFVGFWVIDPEPLLVGTSLEWWYAENGWRNYQQIVELSRLVNYDNSASKMDKMNYIYQLIMVNMVNSMMFDTESSYNHLKSPMIPHSPRSWGDPCDVPAELCEAGNSWPIWRVQLGRTGNGGRTWENTRIHGSTWNMLINHDKSSDLSLISSRTVPFEAVKQAASSSARTGQKNNQRAGGLVKIISNIPSIFTSARLGVYLQNTEVWNGLNGLNRNQRWDVEGLVAMDMPRFFRWSSIR